MPAIEITAETPETLGDYARISIAFEVRSVFDVLGAAPPFTLAERPIEAAYVKDYDALDGGPATWPARFDLSAWRPFVARVNGRPLGGAAVAARRGAYPELPGEVQLVWSKELA